jgi:uncharacterized protein (TIGR02391 family)
LRSSNRRFVADAIARAETRGRAQQSSVTMLAARRPLGNARHLGRRPSGTGSVRVARQHDRVLPWPHPDDGVQLPVEDLAMRVLHRIVHDESLHGRDRVTRVDEERYWGAYRPPDGGEPQPRVGHREWQQALSVAVDWLYINGLIAHDSNQSSANWFIVTELGRQTATAPDGRRFFDAHRSLTVDLHPSIRGQVRRLFLMGEIEPAVVAALRQVEIEVRRRARASKAAIGKRLMAMAFKPGAGPLVDPALEASEQEGIMQLYMGLIGAFKNTSSHHQVDFDDPTEAVEVILFSDLLLRMLDRGMQPDEPGASP